MDSEPYFWWSAGIRTLTAVPSWMPGQYQHRDHHPSRYAPHALNEPAYSPHPSSLCLPSWEFVVVRPNTAPTEPTADRALVVRDSCCC
jgi:hypothetical protein